ncbi:MAG: hypothetical protein LIO41_06270 [Ruminococcus sp.]|nr:hypothetical protein [Ruminococcus sp.]
MTITSLTLSVSPEKIDLVTLSHSALKKLFSPPTIGSLKLLAEGVRVTDL